MELLKIIEKKICKPPFCLFGGIMALILTGCIPMPPMYSGLTLDKKQIDNIHPGKSTKYEILSSLGPPLAIAVRDEPVTFESPTIWIIRNDHKPQLAPGKYNEIESDLFFELFSSQHDLTEYHRVYYYYSALSRLHIWFGGMYKKAKTDIDELWILVNEKTGIVEDYFLKKEGSS